MLVKDIRPGPASSTPGLFFSPNARIGRDLFFSADNGFHGVELWKTDGTTAGTVPVKDIAGGPPSSSPLGLYVHGDTLYFSARVFGVSGRELWRSDGTTAGTRIVKDIHPGALDSSPTRFTSLNGSVVFSATNGAGTELWKSDGTTAGTMLIKDLLPGTVNSNPEWLTVLNPSPVDDVLPSAFRTKMGSTGNQIPHAYHNSRSQQVFLGSEIGGPRKWDELCLRLDERFTNTTSSRQSIEVILGPTTRDNRNLGTTFASNYTGPTTRVFDGILDLPIHRGGGNTTSFNVCIKFSTPYIYTSGNLIVDMINKSATSQGHFYDYCLNDPGSTTMRVFALDNSATSGRQGNAQGLIMRLGGTTGGVGKILFFAANDVVGKELYETDGTAPGTKLIKDIRPGIHTNSASPYSLACCFAGPDMYFAASDGVHGKELWKTDGTAAGTVLVKDIHPGDRSSGPAEIRCCWVGDKLQVFFTADDGGNGRELWVTDGTTAGTVMVKDIRSGSSSSSPALLTPCNGMLLFRAVGTVSGSELWKSDGTAAGTVVVKDIVLGSAGSTPSNLLCCKGTVYFSASDQRTGTELWKTDGSAAGTVLVKDIQAGPSSSGPTALACWGDTIYFSAATTGSGGTGRELWKSDGTSAGTVLVKDINPGTADSSPFNIVCCGDKIYFRALASGSGTELYVSNGTSAGTSLVKDIRAGPMSGFPSNLVCCDGRLFFTANDGVSGVELFRTDGTAAGTVLVKDLSVGGSSAPSSLKCVGKLVYFSAIASQKTGRELYVSDGTSAGTTQVCELFPGSRSSVPAHLTCCGNRLYFTATDGTNGQEMFYVDNAGAMVMPLGTSNRDAFSTLEATAPVTGQASTYKYACGPAGHVGIIWLGQTDGPVAHPAFKPGTCVVNFVLPNFWFFGTVSPPSGSFQIPIPNGPNLPGLKFATQIWWVNPPALTPIEATNGLLQVIGTK